MSTHPDPIEVVAWARRVSCRDLPRKERLSPKKLAKMAQLSECALLNLHKESWNPRLSTLRKLNALRREREKPTAVSASVD